MDDINPNLELARGRLTNLVKFLREFHRLRNPVVQEVGRYSGGFSFWFDELPEHDAIERGWQEDDADYLLRITRPNITSCPSPPDQLGEWLRPGWDDPSTDVEFFDVIETPSLIDEDDDEIRRFEEAVVDFRIDLDRWNAQRQQWVETEIPARVTDKAYQDLYRLHGRLEAERERLDLQVGDGLLRWNTDSRFCQNSVPGQNSIVPHLLRRSINALPTLPICVRIQEKTSNLAGLPDFLLRRL